MGKEGNVSDETEDEVHHKPSVSISVLVCWVVPVMLIAVASRFAVDTTPSAPQKAQSMPVNLFEDTETKRPTSGPVSGGNDAGSVKTEGPSAMPTVLSSKPSSYIGVVESIGRRRLDWDDVSSDPVAGYERAQMVQAQSFSQSPESSDDSAQRKATGSEPKTRDTPRGASTDPERMDFLQEISHLRRLYENQPNELSNAIALAEALRVFDLQYHDGGSSQKEAIETFHKAIELAQSTREEMVRSGLDTSHSAVDPVYGELLLDYSNRSIDGMLCALFTSLGKTYFMANMFELAVESYSRALEIEPLYLDAMSSRGSSYIILGEYAAAAIDLSMVMKNDSGRRFQDVFTGLARILQAKESAVPEGWSPMIEIVVQLISLLESQMDSIGTERSGVILNSLNRLYHVLFIYHDAKTGDTGLAWEALTKSYGYKMRTLPPFNASLERQKVSATKQIFHRGFFPEGVGSQTMTPIFIIGFVRSGSTLLERVLDAHPAIYGSGENSVFNGQLDHIRNKIVEASMVDSSNLSSVIEGLADGVVDEMVRRWEMVAGEGVEPTRLVDKMLTNYYNVGFIHMLFPNALILHVAREPMDTLLSAYKHEFPPGSLDYTSSFPSLAELYHSYRELMEHWDTELPGRVTHVRYEDMVNDMPGIARKLIEAAGLDWDESVLDFHAKKHAVNTLSTTQVRKGVYKDSLQAWRRYAKLLNPLMELIGDEVSYDHLRTTVRGYLPPTGSVINDGEL